MEKLLIFIVAYNAEKHIKKVLDRIPKNLFLQYDCEILIIDDHSKDETFKEANIYINANEEMNIKVLFNPVNLGYGGNQKLGYRYAIKHNFDYVVLLHGDGQYAPEIIDKMVQPLSENDKDFVIGSRMINKEDALKGGMPYYKFVGNIILTKLQNYILKSDLKEFHSGYRAYRTEALKRIPFEQNSNDYNFDTQIIIQSLLANFKIFEISIPTYYGDEICHVNGVKYGLQILKDSIDSRLHSLNIFYKKIYDIERSEPIYDIKLGYPSSHTMAIDAVAPNSTVLDIGAGEGLIAKILKNEKNCSLVGIDLNEKYNREVFTNFYLEDIDQVDLSKIKEKYTQIILLDIIEHLKSPEDLLYKIRLASGMNIPKLIITTPNIAYFIIRLQLLFGQFNYGKKGILDLTHTRLFTFKSLRDLLIQNGYTVKVVKGIPAPFPKAIGLNSISKLLLSLNKFLIFVSKSMFSYQIYLEAYPTPLVENLLEHTIKTSKEKNENNL